MTNKGSDTAYDLDEADSNAVLESLIERSGGQVKLFAKNEAAVANLSLYANEVDGLSQAVLATLPEAIPLEQNGYESGACDVVVEGLLLNPLSTADMALHNRGGCRESFDEVSKKQKQKPMQKKCSSFHYPQYVSTTLSSIH